MDGLIGEREESDFYLIIYYFIFYLIQFKFIYLLIYSFIHLTMSLNSFLQWLYQHYKYVYLEQPYNSMKWINLRSTKQPTDAHTTEL